MEVSRHLKGVEIGEEEKPWDPVHLWQVVLDLSLHRIIGIDCLLEDERLTSKSLQNMKLRLLKGDGWVGVVLICFLLIEAK